MVDLLAGGTHEVTSQLEGVSRFHVWRAKIGAKRFMPRTKSSIPVSWPSYGIPPKTYQYLTQIPDCTDLQIQYDSSSCRRVGGRTHISAWYTHILVGHVSWVGFVLYRSSTAPQNGRLEYRWSICRWFICRWSICVRKICRWCICRWSICRLSICRWFTCRWSIWSFRRAKQSRTDRNHPHKISRTDENQLLFITTRGISSSSPILVYLVYRA